MNPILGDYIPLKAGVADLQQLKTNYLITPDTYFMSFFLLRSTTAGLGCPLATNSFPLAHQMAVYSPFQHVCFHGFPETDFLGINFV